MPKAKHSRILGYAATARESNEAIARLRRLGRYTTRVISGRGIARDAQRHGQESALAFAGENNKKLMQAARIQTAYRYYAIQEPSDV